MGSSIARANRTDEADAASPATTSTDLVWAVVRLRAALRNEVRRETTTPQLDEPERDLLMVLWDHGVMGLSDAAGRAVLSMPAARRAADGLSKRGLVRRKADEFDPSGISLEPTTAAETRLTDGLELSGRIMAQGLDSLEAGDLALMPEVVSTLEELTTRLETRAAAPQASVRTPAPAQARPRKNADAAAHLKKITMGAEERARDKNPLEVLAETGNLVQDLRAFEFELVHELRALGYSWQKIADALGISKQTAHARYASPAQRT